MKDTQIKLTSVKVIQNLYESFKSKTVNSSMNLQKLEYLVVQIVVVQKETPLGV